MTAPLNRVPAAVRRGDTVRIDVVVRTKSVGHFFPGGTVDAYDTWLELKGVDDRGQTVFWSGMVEDGGKGPVEKGAHFYRSLQIDGHGNRDQQAQCVGDAVGCIRAADSAGGGGYGALPHEGSGEGGRRKSR